MATHSEGGGGKDELKTHFITREGTYKLMQLSEYSRPTRVALNGQCNTPVKVSFINVNDGSGSQEKLCFNVGREIYTYVYKGIRKAADLTKPIDKRMYKGTFPTCHDFNEFVVSSESVLLLIGFTGGQIQLIDPIKKDICKLYNEDKLIDKTKVSCIRWVPGSPNQFLVSHSSGHLYCYNEELPCGPTPPHYQPFKQGEGYCINTCKTKSTKNPLYRWVIGQGGVSEFAFSPCSKYLAVVGQDGFLRVFNYDTMDLVGSMKSYFGGLLCICWSPDGKYIVTGGEDDLVTVWSFHEKRVLCRGHGHKSWVNMVAFDPYTMCVSDEESCDIIDPSKVTKNLIGDNVNSRKESPSQDYSQTNGTKTFPLSSSSDGKMLNIASYRFGSIGQDTLFCLWDLTEDIIKQPVGRSRTSVHVNASMQFSSHTLPRCNSLQHAPKANSVNSVPNDHSVLDGNIPNSTGSVTSKFATLSVAERKDFQEKKEHKRNFSLASKSDKVNFMKSNHVRPIDDGIKLLGTPSCPRLDEAPMLEPLVCKKVAHERLTTLAFREECIVTACCDGLVNTWARPGKISLTQQHSVGSQQPSTGDDGT